MLIFSGSYLLDINKHYIYKSDWFSWQFHFFPSRYGGIFVSSCEFNGLVSKSRRIPPVALFFALYDRNMMRSCHRYRT